METIDIIVIVLGCIFSYLLGGVSIARLITQRETANIDKQGSGNPGTMNMMRTHGIGMGVFTLFCDALKGALPALFGKLYFGEYVQNSLLAYLTLYLFGLCAVLGHIFPIYYKFKGGKGIATTIGMFFVADYLTGLVLFGIMFITLYFIKIGSVVSLLFITIMSVVQLFKPYMEDNGWAIVCMIAIVVLDYWAHRQNFLRLIENRENAADLQEGLKKDIEKIKQKKERKLEKNEQKQERIEQKYEEKINRKNEKVNKKLEKLAKKETSTTNNVLD